MLSRIRMLPAVVAFLVVGCDGASGMSQVEVSDSAGVAITRNRADDFAAEVKLTTVRSLGGKETEEESFYSVGRAATSTDGAGNIYVLDRSAFRVQVFDSAGRHLRTMGGEGGGPGELQYPFAMTVTPDGIVRVADVGKRAFVRWDNTGAILESEPLPSSYFGGEVRWSASGMVVPVGGGLANRLILLAGSGDTITLASMPRGETKSIDLESCGMGFSGMEPLFTPQLTWTTSGDRVAVARNPEYVLDIHEGGKLVRSIRRDVAPRPATADLAEAALGEGMKVRVEGEGERVCDPAEVVEKRGFASFLHTISRVALSPDGMLWVQWFGVGDEPTAIDIFDADGEYIGSVRDSATFPIAFLPDGRFLTIEKDEYDVERLVLRSMTR